MITDWGRNFGYANTHASYELKWVIKVYKKPLNIFNKSILLATCSAVFSRLGNWLGEKTAVTVVWTLSMCIIRHVNCIQTSAAKVVTQQIKRCWGRHLNTPQWIWGGQNKVDTLKDVRYDCKKKIIID